MSSCEISDLAWQCIGKRTQEAISLIENQGHRYEITKQKIGTLSQGPYSKIILLENNGFVVSAKLG